LFLKIKMIFRDNQLLNHLNILSIQVTIQIGIPEVGNKIVHFLYISMKMLRKI
jgi:hypothetical protein